MSETLQKLKEIIETSYQIFSKYKLGDSLDICSHCVSEEEEKVLLETPLREITKEIIYSYYSSAQNYGEQELYEMKYFLPRVLELLTKFEFPYHSVEISLSRFNLQTDNFETQEKEILNKFAENYFAYCLENYPFPDGEDIDSIILMFGLAGFSLPLILQKWTEKIENNYLLHLNDFFINQVEYDGYKPFKLRNAFSTKEIDRKIFDWFSREDIKAKFAKNIETAIEQNILAESDEFQLSMLYEAMIL